MGKAVEKRESVSRLTNTEDERSNTGAGSNPVLATKTKVMQIRFYKEKTGMWYADLPDYIASGGTKADCQMVSGADDWLDLISQCEYEVTLEISTEKFEGAEYLYLDHTDEGFPEMGATYRVTTYQGIDYSNRTMWLCPVTLFVFGEYPKDIYYLKTK